MRDVLDAITRLELVYEDVSPHLSNTDADFTCRAILHYKTLLADGGFDQSRLDVSWSEFNDRYGSMSIDGFTAEVLAVGIWNKHNKHTTFAFGDGQKNTEVSGCDVVVNNPNWNRSYVVQVKNVTSLNSTIIAKSNWLKYSTFAVNRLVLVHTAQRKLLCMDYLKFLQYQHDNEFMHVDALVKLKNSRMLSL